MQKDKNKLAQNLRKNQTRAEKKLWSRIRKGQLEGIKFRRQHPLGDYILDFVSFDINLDIEVDGGQHFDSDEDENRDKWLRKKGFSVLRFWNNQVLENTDGVVKEIREEIKKLK